VAGYARVSCGKDEMLHSLAAQVSHYSGLIQSRPEWEYVGVYADEALTGTKDTRPEFQRLIADCRAGRTDLVLTKSISRFARNTVTLLETVRELKALGIGVLFEEQGIHTLGADGELMLTILAGYAQEESLSTSENCKWRIRKDFREGKPSGHIRMYGYDFKDGKLTVIPEEADVVRMIFADYLGGMGKPAIVKKLTRLGVPTKGGGRWNESTIGGILANEKFIGDMCLQKGFITDHITKRHKPNKGELPKYYVEGSHEAIISRDTFDAVQAERARRAAKVNRPAPRVFSEFSGVIRCGRCGARFRRSINGAGTKYAKVTWACMTYIHRGKDECPARRIPEDILKAKCAEVLGLSEYNSEAFTATVAAIHVPADGALTFILKDGTEWTISWEHRSRRESWTDEMKAAAKAKSKEGRING
jgi:DNA invertase Pin-like site-specific DNA recombinase